ncbi:ribonuclease H-like domain-containing protein, partial [Pterulicium gracile]
DSIPALRAMIFGKVQHTDAQKQPGKYVALDCEMVGVGIDGEESSLARVSIVNFHGVVLLDEFVSQKERVVDYRTQWSGIRPADMVHAHPFEEVQKRVADLLQDRILIGHAVYNDLKALLLAHPRSYTRDTQHLAYKHKVVKGKRPALRNLVKQELGVAIQEGEHSSVTDARATIAIFRIHRKEWEKDQKAPLMRATAVADPQSEEDEEPVALDHGKGSKKRSATDDLSEDDSDIEPEPPAKSTRSKKVASRPPRAGSGKTGISTGLTVVVKRRGVKSKEGRAAVQSKTKSADPDWWKRLG